MALLRAFFAGARRDAIGYSSDDAFGAAEAASHKTKSMRDTMASNNMPVVRIAPNNQVFDLWMRTNGGISNYNAGFLSIQRRFAGEV